MPFLLKRFRPNQVFNVYKALSTTPVKQAYYFPDFKAGPCPRTKEEREAAAKKYNLLPEEYEPYSDNEHQIGDYPKLPRESVDAKDPFYPWDYPDLRRNYNEAVDFKIISLLPARISTRPRKYTDFEGIRNFLLLTAGSILFIYALDQIAFYYPLTEKQYPTPGVTHYTFELLSEGLGNVHFSQVVVEILNYFMT